MKTLISILFLISGLTLYGQSDRIDSLLNDLIFSDEELVSVPDNQIKYDFISFGTNYNSNTYYAGRDVGSTMYNFSGNIFYYNSSGFFLGTSGIWFNQLTPSFSSATISAGYSKAIDKKKHLYIRTAYSRYLYYQPDPTSYYPYKNSINAGLSFRNKWIGVRFSSVYSFGDESKINISGGINSKLTLMKFGKYNKLYLTPEISAFMGPETVNSNSSGTNTKEVFSLLNTQFFMPLCLSVGDFDLDFGFLVNFPTTKDALVTYPTNTMFSIGLSYLIPIAKQ